jgi:hypothetical protein
MYKHTNAHIHARVHPANQQLQVSGLNHVTKLECALEEQVAQVLAVRSSYEKDRRGGGGTMPHAARRCLDVLKGECLE